MSPAPEVHHPQPGPSRALLPQLLAGSLGPAHLSLRQWDEAVRQARSERLMGSLAALVARSEHADRVPEQVSRHLRSAQAVSNRQQRTVHWEVAQLRPVLAGVQLPVLLLKGAAYVMAELPPGAGRTFSDIDIMVPRDAIEAVERALLADGWMHLTEDDYDEHYFREWMHEIPPLQHRQRRTVLDVHHNILPLTTNVGVDASELLTGAVSIVADGSVQVLAPADIVLHSAAHLFYGGEFQSGLRDLHDLLLLLGHYGRTQDWGALTARAATLNLRTPLHYAVRYVTRIFGTGWIEPADLQRHFGPDLAARHVLLDPLFEAVFMPRDDNGRGLGFRLARLALFVRGHYLRMPLRILIPHLLRKSLRKPKEA